MATWPAKTNYATGDVLTAAQMNDIGGELNDLYTSSGFAAGKNKIINGDFRWNQRNFTSTTTSATYGFDRFFVITSDGTGTYSAQTFTAGTAPVSGYEAINFAQLVTTGQTLASAQTRLCQAIEDVRTFADQTVTVSFWAKTTSGTPKIALELQQYFGLGGSPSATVNTYAGQVTISTSWTRYSVTVAVPSISGKTLGTANDHYLGLNLFVSAGSNFNSRTGTLGIQSNTFQFWGVQVEAGNTATAFQTATGTIQGELAACQRYYVRFTGNTAYSPIGLGYGESSTNVAYSIMLPVTPRTNITTIDYANVANSDGTNTTAVTNLVVLNGGTQNVSLRGSQASGITQFRPYGLINNNNTAGYVGFSAEL